MTQPARAIQTKEGRVYPWPSVEPYEFVARSVTTLLRDGIPKPKLVGHSARMAAECVLDNYQILQRMPKPDAIQWASEASIRHRDGKGVIGDEIHEVIEQYTKHGKLPERGEVSPACWGCWLAFCAFCKKWKPEFLYSEPTIFSRTYKYAGSTDNIALFDFQDGRGWVNTIIDYKSSPRIYDDVGLQLCMYAKGDFMAFDDDDTEFELPEIQDGLAVRLGIDGKYTAIPFTLDSELLDLFQAVIEVANRDVILKGARRKALNSRPRKDK